eukprot:TRINITY_DN11965_c0_g1_i2.p2 TRINITY_DN11965_c0_g1~~TRINITY_DN11965_c0_g1_i2.p2  ORF type:complete len:236 (+),score=60.25 TRINITY_DN11965_c0_g1_i2:1661-2368(+)
MLNKNITPLEGLSLSNKALEKYHSQFTQEKKKKMPIQEESSIKRILEQNEDSAEQSPRQDNSKQNISMQFEKNSAEMASPYLPSRKPTQQQIESTEPTTRQKLTKKKQIKGFHDDSDNGDPPIEKQDIQDIQLILQGNDKLNKDEQTFDFSAIQSEQNVQNQNIDQISGISKLQEADQDMHTQQLKGILSKYAINQESQQKDSFIIENQIMKQQTSPQKSKTNKKFESSILNSKY